MLKKIKNLKKYTDCSMPSNEKERIHKAEISVYNEAIEDILSIIKLKKGDEETDDILENKIKDLKTFIEQKTDLGTANYLGKEIREICGIVESKSYELNKSMGCEVLEVKEGDVIEWDFKSDEYPHLGDELRGKTFRSQVAAVLKVQREYCVYASYGQDYIPFDDCRLIEIKCD